MSELKTNNSIASNMIWHLAEKWGCQIVSFIVTIIISRKIDPSIYGVVAISNIYISIFSTFIDGGLGNSLIQKKDSDELDFSTVFIANTLLCIVVYFIIFLVAPYVAVYYGNESIKDLLRVSGLIIIFSALKNVQHAYVSKNMIFRKFFFASLLGTVLSGIIGIVMAYNNYGAWSLVCASVSDVIIDTIVMWFTIGWKPKPLFSFQRLKTLFNYGWKILVSTFVDRVYNKMYHLTIGKYCPSSDLAYYEKGYSITSKLSDNTNLVVNSVLFPAMSNKQNEKEEIKKIAKSTLKINFYIMTPLLVGLMVITESLIRVVLTEKWILAAPFIKLFCIINLFAPFDSVNTNIIKSTGHSEIVLKQEIIKKIVCIVILIVSVKYGAMAILISKLISVIIGVIINSYPNKKLVNYGIVEQLMDVVNTLIITAIMVLAIYFIPMLNVNNFLTMCIQIFVGATVYILVSYLIKDSSFKYLLNLVLNRFNKPSKE